MIAIPIVLWSWAGGFLAYDAGLVQVGRYRKVNAGQSIQIQVDQAARLRIVERWVKEARP